MGISRYTRSWFRRRRENITAVRDPVVIEDEEQQDVVPEEGAPEGDPFLAHEAYLQEYGDYSGGEDWRVEYRQGGAPPEDEDEVNNHVPGEGDPVDAPAAVEEVDYVPGRDNPYNPYEEGWAESGLSTLTLTYSEEVEQFVACEMCAVSEAVKGDLCRACWRWTRTVDQALKEHRERHNRAGRTRDDPVIISSDDEE